MRRSTTHTSAALAALLLLIAAPTLGTVSTSGVPGECVSACAGGELATFDPAIDLCVCVQGPAEDLAQGEQGSWWSGLVAFVADWAIGGAESGVAWYSLGGS